MKISKPLLVKITPYFATGAFCLVLGFFVEQGFEKYQEKRLLTSDEAAMESLDKIIVLPEEIPSIATVTDKNQLVDQPFFTKAENGDKVIIYKESRRAYLFRPQEKKIIDMTVIAVETPSTPSQETLPVFQTGQQ